MQTNSPTRSSNNLSSNPPINSFFPSNTDFQNFPINLLEISSFNRKPIQSRGQMWPYSLGSCWVLFWMGYTVKGTGYSVAEGPGKTLCQSPGRPWNSSPVPNPVVTKLSATYIELQPVSPSVLSPSPNRVSKTVTNEKKKKYPLRAFIEEIIKNFIPWSLYVPIECMSLQYRDPIDMEAAPSRIASPI